MADQKKYEPQAISGKEQFRSHIETNRAFGGFYARLREMEAERTREQKAKEEPPAEPAGTS